VNGQAHLRALRILFNLSWDEHKKPACWQQPIFALSTLKHLLQYVYLTLMTCSPFIFTYYH